MPYSHTGRLLRHLSNNSTSAGEAKQLLVSTQYFSKGGKQALRATVEQQLMFPTSGDVNLAVHQSSLPKPIQLLCAPLPQPAESISDSMLGSLACGEPPPVNPDPASERLVYIPVRYRCIAEPFSSSVVNKCVWLLSKNLVQHRVNQVRRKDGRKIFSCGWEVSPS